MSVCEKTCRSVGATLQVMVGPVFRSTAMRVFSMVTARPRTAIGACVVAVVAAGLWMPTLKRETRPDAFIPDDDPALHYREQVREVFALSDQMAVLVVNPGDHGVFTPHTLALVNRLTDQLADMPGIHPQRVTSVATEDHIVGDEAGLTIEPLMPRRAGALTPAEAAEVRRRVFSFEPYVGRLVSPAGDATLLLVELEADADHDAVYERVMDLVAAADTRREQLHG